MRAQHRFRRTTSGVLGALTFLLVASTPAIAAGNLTTAATDRTSAQERKRVDRLPTPKPHWYKCIDMARTQCAVVRLPLDYDHPKAGTTKVAVLRIKARKPKQRIGSLFVNPGGPGGSAVNLAMAADRWLSNDILDRFDIVGIDPRGIALSENLRCFPNPGAQDRAMAGLNVAFPVSREESARYIRAAGRVAKGCSTTGKRLAGAMSTAEVARDMEMMRRAVGDKKLSFFGFSYGTALGQYYANMFPDRVRAIVVDGVVNPVSWTGTPATGGQILDERLRSADGAYKAMRELLARCGKAGEKYCPLAAGGDPATKFRTVIERLKTKPIDLPARGNEPAFTLDYPGFVSGTLSALYDPAGLDAIIAMTNDLYKASSPVSALAVTGKRDLAASAHALRAWAVPGRGFPYVNELEAYSGVICTDGRHPAKGTSWPAMVAKADRRAPDFGPAWAWATVQCATDKWKVRDKTAYTGPFNRRSSAPVLVVGNYYDPATNYAEAVSASKLLGNARLLSSDSWGHTAYGTSPCVTRAVGAYLLKGTLPKAGTVCKGDVQPFTKLPQPSSAQTPARMRDILPTGPGALAQQPTGVKKLPPVVLPPQFRNW
jgi:pimeloyl-ACP methyl ester carboxylesterase